MLGLHRFLKRFSQNAEATPRAGSPITLETLESRMLLSASHHVAHAATHRLSFAEDSAGTGSTISRTTVEFSTLSTAAQDGLTALAQGVTIDAAQNVTVRTKSDDSVVYSTVVNVDGVKSRIAVDTDGNPLQGKLAFSAAPDAVKTGLQAQATDAIAEDQLVSIRARGDGTVIYSTTITVNTVATTIAVDASGNKVTEPGDRTTVEFSTLSTTVQNALTSLTQGTAIDAAQAIDVNTRSDSTTVYSVVLAINGTASRIAVDADGSLLEGRIAFSATPSAVQTGLQTLDTAGTIPDTQLVQISTRRDDTTVYSTTVMLDGQATIIAVDSTGAEVDNSGRGCSRGGGGGGFRGRGDESGWIISDESAAASFDPAASGGSGFGTNVAGPFGFFFLRG